MSVARTREINARLRAAGITVHEWPGWESRGNGQTSAYEGCIVHHTASPYGFTYPTLVDGRPDLAGPLCNWGGNEDGSLTVVAAHPANHAGASGGPSMGPLPVTTLFNRRVMGLEIIYPGTSPMRPAQYRTATIWTRVVTDVVGYGDIQRGRAHAETSITGKWDPGYALGKTIDMRRFRSDALAVLAQPPEDSMTELTGRSLQLLEELHWQERARLDAMNGRPFPDDDNQWGHVMSHYAHSRKTVVPKLDAIRAVLDAQGALLAQLQTGGEITPERWAEVVAAAEQGARDGAREGVTTDILAAIAELEQRLNADDADQARDGARQVLTQLRDSLPT